MNTVYKGRFMKIPTDDEVIQTILEQGPLTPEELARLAYPVRTVYLALMLSWAQEHGLNNLVGQRESLKPMMLRCLEEVAEYINSVWRRRTDAAISGRTRTLGSLEFGAGLA